jgi:hypothetical protein
VQVGKGLAISGNAPKASPTLKSVIQRMKGFAFFESVEPGKKSYWYEIGCPLKYDGTPGPLYDFQECKIILKFLLSIREPKCYVRTE